MGRRVGVQSANEAELIDLLRHVRIELGDPRAGLPVLGEAKFRAGEGAAAGADLAVISLQLRLVFPRIDLRRGPLHEEEDDPLGLHAELWRLGGDQRAGRWTRDAGGRAARGRLTQEPGERDETETAARGFERLSPGENRIRRQPGKRRTRHCSDLWW